MDGQFTNYRDVYSEYKKRYDYYHKVLGDLQVKKDHLSELNRSLAHAEHMRDQSHNSYVAADVSYTQNEKKFKEVTRAYESGKQPKDNQIKTELKEYEQELRRQLDSPASSLYGNLIEKDRYDAVVENTKKQYSNKKQQYISDREKAIRVDLSNARSTLNIFMQDRKEKTKVATLEDYPKEVEKVTKKIKEIDSYLEKPAVKKYSKSIDVKKLILSENVEPLGNVSCRKDLFDAISHIKTPSEMHLRTQDENKSKVLERASNSDNVNLASFIIGGIFFIIALIICYKLKPVDYFLPHIINGGLLAGPAGAIRFVIVWAINLVLAFIILVIAFYLVNSTPIALLFYPQESKVRADLQSYYNYVKVNRSLFASLYDFWTAAAFAYEEELSTKIDETNCLLGTIENEPGYKKIVQEEDEELQRISKASENQKKKFVEDLQRKKRELKEADEKRIRSLKDNYDRLEKALKDSKKKRENSLSDSEKYMQRFLQLKSEVDALDKEITVLQVEGATVYDSLKEDTAHFFDTNYYTNSIIEMIKPASLNAFRGMLSDRVFLINDKKDKDELAVLTELSLRCLPTVMLYKKEDLLTPNIGKELYSFIKWLYDGLLRVNPLLLFDDNKINIIDPVTSGLVFKDTTSFPNVRVYSSSSELNDFTLNISRHMDIVTRACLELHQAIDIKSVNNEKAKRNAEVTYYDNSPHEMRENYCTYSVSIFILPQETKDKKSTNSIINEELKRNFRNCEEFGILPIFIIDQETFNLDSPGPTVEALKDIMLNECIYSLDGVGKRSKKPLSILQGNIQSITNE